MIIKTKQDAKKIVNRIALFMVEKGTDTIGILKMVSISPESITWVGKHHNVATICRTDNEIIDFVYKHRKQFNSNSQLANIDWNRLEQIVDTYSQIVEDGIMDIGGYIVLMDEFAEMIRDYDRRLQLAYEKTGDERAKALLGSSWDEDDVCELLAELEGWD